MILKDSIIERLRERDQKRPSPSSFYPKIDSTPNSTRLLTDSRPFHGLRTYDLSEDNADDVLKGEIAFFQNLGQGFHLWFSSDANP